MIATGPRWVPPLSCPCGAVRHHPGARYYVSVRDDSRTVLAAGPYLTHPEALAVVGIVNRIVLNKYNPQGRAHWWSYGTVAMPYGYDRPEHLNTDVAAASVIEHVEIAPLPKRSRSKRTISAYHHGLVKKERV